jgi:hypothetical protein
MNNIETGTGALMETGAIAAAVKIITDAVKLALPGVPTWVLLTIVGVLSLGFTLAAQVMTGQAFTAQLIASSIFQAVSVFGIAFAATELQKKAEERRDVVKAQQRGVQAQGPNPNMTNPWSTPQGDVGDAIHPDEVFGAIDDHTRRADGTD